MEEYVERLKTIWESGQLTNNGSLVRELESRLCEYLGVKHCILVSNGDAGLRVAIRGLELYDEVITTPFSYVSTASSIKWLGLTPVFADIEPDSLTIDPEKVEQLITPKTSAIMATHVYGNPCNVDRLNEIAKRHKLRIIYDAAHAFGVEYQGAGIAGFGDVSMFSLHATKVYHSGEGGVLATNDTEIYEAIEWRRRFGHNGQDGFHGVAINAKMSEFHAAMGLCVLDHLDQLISARRVATETYDQMLTENPGVKLTRPGLRADTKYNYSYYPVIYESESRLLQSFDSLKQVNIHPRRYFYPSLNLVSSLGEFETQPISEAVAPRVACLPLSANISANDISRVIENLV
jgi:dTDP-4-amino-4,6-dideoxygalactose transaminase